MHITAISSVNAVLENEDINEYMYKDTIQLYTEKVRDYWLQSLLLLTFAECYGKWRSPLSEEDCTAVDSDSRSLPSDCTLNLSNDIKNFDLITTSL